ncbi:MAG: hypothetical protein LBK98_06500 [Peptococcaceae bacterium]|jgi:hypothetical protein|nr:hypothetical protein [Peptococcaceae bacterium]
MKRLIKTIEGADREIYAIHRHRRLFVGKATPKIEIYQVSAEVKTIGGVHGQREAYEFSLIICSDTEMDWKMTDELPGDLSHFDLKMLLPREDAVFIPFELAGLTNVSMKPGRWVFEVNAYEITQELLAM